MQHAALFWLSGRQSSMLCDPQVHGHGKSPVHVLVILVKNGIPLWLCCPHCQPLLMKGSCAVM